LKTLTAHLHLAVWSDADDAVLERGAHGVDGLGLQKIKLS
jgi:hypothetical protein